MFSYSYYTCVCMCDWERERERVCMCACEPLSPGEAVALPVEALVCWPGSQAAFLSHPQFCPVHPGLQVWAVSAFSTRPPSGPTSFYLSGEDFLVGLFLTLLSCCVMMHPLMGNLHACPCAGVALELLESLVWCTLHC